MGTSRWDDAHYASYSSSRSVMNREQIFRGREISPDMDPKNITFRESRDSEANPNSTPIIVGLDLTGSMGFIAEYLAKTGLGIMVNHVLERRPVSDPSICIVGIGDADYGRGGDDAPLQIGQFESDIVITEWLEKLYIEGGGGGNDHESYDLPYYFGLYHTRTDSFEKRNSPGVLITIGDELPCVETTVRNTRKVFGASAQHNISFSDMVESIRPMYTPYHIIIAEGSYARRNLSRVETAWREYLGCGAMVITDHTKTAELIVTMLDVDAGRGLDDALSGWPEETKRILRRSFECFISSGNRRLSRRMDA